MSGISLLLLQATEEAGIRCKMGFFLHIPFPAWDIFRLFPWSDEILQGMLGTLVKKIGKQKRIVAVHNRTQVETNAPLPYLRHIFA